MQTRSVVVFDLIGVVLPADFDKTTQAFLEHGIEIKYEKEFRDLVKRYERGDIKTREVYHAIKEKYSVKNPASLTYAQFVKAWNAMLVFIPDETIEYIRRLKASGHTTILISNINSLHIRNIEKTYSNLFNQLFDKVLYSYQTRVLKPEQEAYEKVFSYLEEHHIAYDKIVYIDDSERNIDAGKKLDLISIKYPTNGLDEQKKHVSIRSALNEHVLLFKPKKMLTPSQGSYLIDEAKQSCLRKNK